MKGPTINVRQVLGVAGAFHTGGVRATRLRNDLVTQGRDTTQEVRAAVADVVQRARRRNTDLRRTAGRKLRHPFGDTSRHEDVEVTDVGEIRAALDELAAIGRELGEIQQALASFISDPDLPGPSQAAMHEEPNAPVTSPETTVGKRERTSLDDSGMPPLTFRFGTPRTTTPP